MAGEEIINITTNAVDVYHFVCVNFNTKSEICKLVQSIDLPDTKLLKLYIVDNSRNLSIDEVNVESVKNLDIEIITPPENLGYFGALRYAIDQFNLLDQANFLGLTNPDIVFSREFFKVLSSIDFPEDLAVIAPEIIAFPRKYKSNPFMLRRPSHDEMKLKLWAHSSTVNLCLYSVISTIKKIVQSKLKSSEKHSNGFSIYAAHGSLLIFRPAY